MLATGRPSPGWAKRSSPLLAIIRLGQRSKPRFGCVPTTPKSSNGCGFAMKFVPSTRPTVLLAGHSVYASGFGVAESWSDAFLRRSRSVSASGEDAMNPGAARVIEADMTLDDGIGLMKEQSWERALLRRGNGNWWSVERSELEQEQGSGQGSTPWAKPPGRRYPPRNWLCGSTPICRSTRPCGCSAHTPSCRW